MRKHTLTWEGRDVNARRITCFFPGASASPPQVTHFAEKGGREVLLILEQLKLSGQLEGKKSPNLLPHVFAGTSLIPAREKEEVDFLGLCPVHSYSCKVLCAMQKPVFVPKVVAGLSQ